MARIPAFCESCGTFLSVENAIGGDGNITFKNCAVTCQCGGRATIVDGTYQFNGDTFKLLRSSRATSGQLKKLLEILGRAKENNYSPGEIAQKINKEVPELSSLSSLLPTTRTELYALLGVLIAAIALYYNYLTYVDSAKQKKNQGPTIQINNSFLSQSNMNSISRNRRPIFRKTGVNQPCVCGSGLKTKKCPCKIKRT